MQASGFSKNLFWDADESSVDLEINRAYVIQRVLERGTVSDLRKLFAYYTLPVVTEVAKSLRTLEPRALSYIAAMSGTPKSDFRCYILKHSRQAPWID